MFTGNSPWLVASPFFKQPTKEYSIAELERETKLTYPALKNHLDYLAEQKIIVWHSEAKPKKIFKLYKANKEYSEFRYWKRIYNTLSLKEVISHLNDSLSPSIIVLFGSYSRGEDQEGSDIDIYVQANEAPLNLRQYSRTLGKELQITTSTNLEDLPDSLQQNIRSGIVLSGRFAAMTRISRSPDPGWANRLRAQARLEAQDLEDLKLTSLLRMRAMYDTLHMYAEAYAVSAGVRFIGDGAHYELIEYLREENMITEAERDFLQRLREKRNELLYEGKQPTLTFVKEIVEKFSKLAEKIAEAQPRKQ